MSYELYRQRLAVYVPVLLFSLVITILAYGAFPFILQNKKSYNNREKAQKTLL